MSVTEISDEVFLLLLILQWIFTFASLRIMRKVHLRLWFVKYAKIKLFIDSFEIGRCCWNIFALRRIFLPFYVWHTISLYAGGYYIIVFVFIAYRAIKLYRFLKYYRQPLSLSLQIREESQKTQK